MGDSIDRLKLLDIFSGVVYRWAHLVHGPFGPLQMAPTKLETLVADLCQRDDPSKAKRAAKSLISLRDRRCIPLLLPVLIDESADGQSFALVVLSRFVENDEILHYLIGKLKSKSTLTRETAAWALKNLPRRKGVKPLLKAARGDRAEVVRTWALYGLQRCYEKYARRGVFSGKLVEEILDAHKRASILKSNPLRFAGFDGLALICDPRFDYLVDRAKKDRRPEAREISKRWEKNIHLRVNRAK